MPSKGFSSKGTENNGCASSRIQQAMKPHIENEPYIYNPLDQTSNTIRLARFMPFDENATKAMQFGMRTFRPRSAKSSSVANGIDPMMHIKLESHILSSAPKFCALSYEWGSPDNPKDIRLDNKSFSIRENLWDGLRALWNVWSIRKVDEYFWADALCIDQENIVERSHQVNLMASIYCSAEIVTVWLGPTADNSELIIPTLKSADWAANLSPYSHLGREKEDSIVALLERPYWSRLWIIQEICMAKDIEILCGEMYLDWDILRGFVDGLIEMIASKRYDQHVSRLRQARACDIVADRGLESGPFTRPKFDLETVITNFGQQECADPRDRIFGCLGLVDFQDMPPFAADYSLSAEELADLVSSHLAVTTSRGLFGPLNRLCRRNLGCKR